MKITNLPTDAQLLDAIERHALKGGRLTISRGPAIYQGHLIRAGRRSEVSLRIALRGALQDADQLPPDKETT